MSSQTSARHLVLIGGGHAHIQVFHAFHKNPPANTRLTIVSDRHTAVYSGMVPGLVAGHYRPEELSFELCAWSDALGAEWIDGRVLGMDGDAHSLELESGERLSYDLCSWNIGSSVAGLDTPGVRAHALATRPIGDFVSEVIPQLQAAILTRGRAPLRLVVVGGGSAGVELAFCLRARALAEGATTPDTTILHANDTLLSTSVPALRKLATKELMRRGILTRPSQRVMRMEAGSLELDSGERVPFDLCVWATGAAPHLTRGWIPVGKTLQHAQYPEVFAVGDCAQLTHAPKTPKAGVYAVREGPVLARNLRAMLDGTPLEDYEPQNEFLSLLNLGDGRAAGSKWNLAFRGKWVMRLKDKIDRKFMTDFSLPMASPLDSSSALQTLFPSGGRRSEP